MPSLSIIIPCYNAAATVTRCLQSVFQQHLLPLEAIAIDDCSSDETLQILQAISSEQPTLKILHHEKNRGVSSARNTGIQAATGDFIMFLDADDELVPDCCEHLLSLARQFQADIAGCNGWRRRADGSQKHFFKPATTSCHFTSLQYLEKQPCTECFDSSCCKIYNREILQKNNIRFCADMKFGEDTLFAHQALLQSNIIVQDSSYCGYIYHDNPVSCVNTIDLQPRLANLEKLLTRLNDLLGSHSKKLLLRKSREYIWTIRKYGQNNKVTVLNSLLASPLWKTIIYPTVRQYANMKHRILLFLIDNHIYFVLHFW